MTHPSPLAIVGASTRAAATSAVRAGFRPIAADLFADADLRRIATATRITPYPDGLLDWLRVTEPPAWMYTGALENHPELVDQMAWIAPLWGNPGDVLARARSPWELADVLRDANLLFPETRPSPDGLPLDGSWLTKTYRGASGSGVRALQETGRQGDKETRRHSEAEYAIESPCLPLSLSPCLVFQQRILGTPASAVFVAAEGTATLLGITRQLIGEPWLGAHGFQFAGSIGPLPVADQVRDTLSVIGNVLAERFELIGLFGVDFVLDGETAWTLEVNPRYTASVEIVERITGVHAIAAHCAACSAGWLESSRPPLRGGALAPPDASPAGGSPEARPQQPACAFHGKAILFAGRDVTISAPFAELALAEASRTPWPTLADVSAAGTVIPVGRPILTLFADGKSMDDIENRLRQRAAEIVVKLHMDSTRLN